MADDKDHATRSELAAMENRLAGQIDRGFAGMHSRMTRFEEEVRPILREQDKQLAVLEFQAQAAEKQARVATSHVANAKRSTSQRATVVGTVASFAVAAVFKAIEMIWGGK